MSTGISLTPSLEIGGSIETGQVAFGTASGVGGDSGLFWDNVNKRLGVGTNIPLGILHLKETAATTRMVMDGAAGQSKIITFRTNGLQRFGFYLNNIAESGGNAGSNLAIRAYNDAGSLLSTPLYIHRNSGNIGINTTTYVGFKLDVNGTARFGATTVQAQGALSTDIAFRVRNSAGGLDIIRAQGDGTVFIGQGAGNVNTGANNTANGVSALFSNTTGSSNTANGFFALFNNTTGGFNTANGVSAGRFIADGTTDNTIANNSIFLGAFTKALANNQTNQIVIGNDAIGAGSNTVTLGNTSIIKTILRGTLNAANLPTSPAGLVTGDIWNNLGILTIV